MKFPKHEASLELTHNIHKTYYEDIKTHLDQQPDYYDHTWATETSKQRCLETDELWTLHWYPNTPVGFYVLHGASLEEVLEKAKEYDNYS